MRTLLAAGAAAFAAVAPAGGGHATLATFAGVWQGHTRTLTITREGRATEVIYSGCCTFVIRLELRLSRPRGTARAASAAVTVTARRVGDTAGWRPPRVGQTATISLRKGELIEGLTGTNYCNAAADRTGVCGA